MSGNPEPVYCIALFHVPDIDAYRREYARQVLPQLGALGARVLVASGTPEVLEGKWPSDWTVVIRFPDRATAMRWYESEAYAPLKRVRLEQVTTGGPAALFEGYPQPR